MAKDISWGGATVALICFGLYQFYKSFETFDMVWNQDTIVSQSFYMLYSMREALFGVGGFLLARIVQAHYHSLPKGTSEDEEIVRG